MGPPHGRVSADCPLLVWFPNRLPGASRTPPPPPPPNHDFFWEAVNALGVVEHVLFCLL